MRATIHYPGGVEGALDLPAMPRVGEIIELHEQPWEVEHIIWHIEGPTRPQIAVRVPNG